MKRRSVSSSSPARPPRRALRPGDLAPGDVRELVQDLQAVRRPGARATVGDEQHPDRMAAASRQRYAGVGGDPELAEERALAQQRIGARILDDERRAVRDREPARRVRQRPLAARRERLGRADLGLEEHAVGVDERHARDRRAEQPRRQAGDPVEGLVGRRVEQARRVQRRQPRGVVLGGAGGAALLCADRPRDARRRARARPRAHVEPPARRGDAPARGDEPHVPGGERLDGPLEDGHADAVVLDAQHDRVRLARERHRQPARRRVPDDVRDELPRGGVQQRVVRADGVRVDAQVDGELRAPRDAVDLDLQGELQAALVQRRRVQPEDGLAQRADGVRQRLVGERERLQVAGARLAHVLLGGEQRLQRVVVQAFADPRALALLGVERLVQQGRATGAELLDLARAALGRDRERHADRADDHHRGERLDEGGLRPGLVERGERDGAEAGGGNRRDERDRARGVGEPHRDRIDDERHARLRQRPAAEGDERQDEPDVGERDLDPRCAAQAACREHDEHGRIRGRRAERDDEAGTVAGGSEHDRERDDGGAADPQPGERLGPRQFPSVARQPIHGPASSLGTAYPPEDMRGVSHPHARLRRRRPLGV